MLQLSFYWSIVEFMSLLYKGLKMSDELWLMKEPTEDFFRHPNRGNAGDSGNQTHGGSSYQVTWHNHNERCHLACGMSDRKGLDHSNPTSAKKLSG